MGPLKPPPYDLIAPDTEELHPDPLPPAVAILPPGVIHTFTAPKGTVVTEELMLQWKRDAVAAYAREQAAKLAAPFKLLPLRTVSGKPERGHAMSKDEQAIEQKIQAKGLIAPRLTPAQIDATIKDAAYYVFPGTTLTICCLTLVNGFHVTGESAAASPENFNEEIGREIAYNNARQKIWALEGYLLRTKLAGA